MEILAAIIMLSSGYYNGLDMTLGVGFNDTPKVCQYMETRLEQMACVQGQIGNDPIGIIRLTTSPTKNLSIVYSHYSSIPSVIDNYEGAALNMLSVEYTFNLMKGAKSWH